jgi:hypothetical protein
MRRSHWIGLTAISVLVTVALLVLQWPPVRRAGAGPDQPVAVRRPIPPTMLEGYAEGQVVALEYHQTFYCPTTPSSDLEPPFGHGDGHPQSEDSDEYQVPPCFVGDTGTGSVLPAELQAAAFPGVKTFWGMAPFFGTALGTSNSPASDVFTQCTEPGPPTNLRKGQFGTCLMHPSTLRVARIPEGPGRQPPDPLVLPQHSHLLPETSSRASWWNLRGVSVYDGAIWPDQDGNCPAGPSHCLTSVAALRTAQKTGQASFDYPSNLFFYVTVHPETP